MRILPDGAPPTRVWTEPGTVVLGPHPALGAGEQGQEHMQARLNDPFLDDGLRIWIQNTARRNFWRVAKWYDLDDLIQDGYMCWARTRVRYPRLIEEPIVYGARARFVAMFKRIYFNEIHDLANSRTKSPVELQIVDLVSASESRGRRTSETSYLEHLVGSCAEEATMAVKIAQAPLCVQNLLAALAKEDGPKQLRARLRKQSHHRETFNERLCRIAGVDPSAIDLEWELNDALSV